MSGAFDPEKLGQLPQGPGVYLMKDRAGRIIYVGKAVNLRSRVRSYFNPGSSDTRAFIPLLERVLGDIETILVANEKEAVLLENELIKRHKPKFNVKLVDDKNFICLRLDTRQKYPRLEVVRRFARDGARYFGPYSSASAIRETLRIVNRYFRLRTCTDHVLVHRRRPCLLYQIGRCPAPCVFPIERDDYQRSVSEVALFLEGRGAELLDALRERMQYASLGQRYEEAARLRDQLFAVERSLERQRIAIAEYRDLDVDVFHAHREADRLTAYVMWLRAGRLQGGQAFLFSGQEFPTGELLASFVNLYYAQGQPPPQEVLLPGDAEDGHRGLQAFLSELSGRAVRVLVPQRGEKRQLLALCLRNAVQAAKEGERSREEVEALLARLQERLGLSRLPRRIECYDISHFQGAAIVASQVAATDGQLDKSRYRRFRIKTLRDQDDFASMYEVMSRRFKRGQQANDLPDLILVDGGKGQLGSAQAAMRDANVEGVDLAALAKSRELGRRGGVRGDGRAERSPERVFVVGKKDPIVLGPHSTELLLLTRLRDEAHRFAITYQSKMLRRRSLQSELDDIPGIGPKRRRAMLRKLGSVKRLRLAAVDELAEVEGFSTALAERVHAHMHGRRDTEDAIRDASLEDAQDAEEASGGKF